MLKKFFPLLLLLASCASGPQNNSIDTTALYSALDPDNEALVNRKDGYVDIQLTIASVEKKDSASLYHIASQYNGKNIGFDVLIPKTENTGFGHGMIITSTGEPSDNFLSMLARLYQVPLGQDAKFRKADTISFVDLEQMVKIQGGKSISGNKMKLFFEEEGKTEDDYKTAEVFFNIDRGNNTVGFNEKDPDYRKDLVYFLAEKK